MSLGVALDSLFLILFRSSGKFRSSIALSFAFRRRLQAVRHFFGFFCSAYVTAFFFGLSACVSAVWCVYVTAFGPSLYLGLRAGFYSPV